MVPMAYFVQFDHNINQRSHTTNVPGVIKVSHAVATPSNSSVSFDPNLTPTFRMPPSVAKENRKRRKQLSSDRRNGLQHNTCYASSTKDGHRVISKVVTIPQPNFTDENCGRLTRTSTPLQENRKQRKVLMARKRSNNNDKENCDPQFSRQQGEHVSCYYAVCNNRNLVFYM
ncbi:uncharacterized protein G2W53_010472 [Senna tora]|uniref:Uncharacterized protein n=1 Tax=Senna tora TaxID=362788 RepID=A0A834WZV3_9FABA|nr:uncharacterized protein G2W53_010472 [Senna tora]